MKELINIQQKLKAPKGQRNTFGNYNYRSAEDILEAVKPLLAENNCVLTISDELVHVGERFYIKATATLHFESEPYGHGSISVSAYAREAESKKGMDESQVTGTASSYARKYALNGLFCIDDTKDADTDEYVKRTTEKTEKKEKRDPNSLANAAERKTFQDLCEALGVECTDILNQCGWHGEKMTYELYGKSMVKLKEISDAKEEAEKHHN